MEKINGSYYEQGFKIGRLFKDAILNETDYIKNIENNKKAMGFLEYYTNILKEKYPFVYEEIKGRADGAGIGYNTYLYYLCYELDEQRVHDENCTTILVNDKKNKFIAHNEDGFYTIDNIKPVIFIDSDSKKFFTIAQSASLPSATVFQSEYGFSYTTNYIALEKKYFKNEFLPRNLFYRILSNAKSPQEALNIIKNVAIAGGASINFIDEKKSRLFNIEKFHDKISVKEVDGIYAHSNHFIHEKFTKYNPSVSWPNCLTSFTRQYFADALICELHGKYTKENILKVLQFYGENDYDAVLQKAQGSPILTYATYVRDFKTKKSNLYKYLEKEEKFEIEL